MEVVKFDSGTQPFGKYRWTSEEMLKKTASFAVQYDLRIVESMDLSPETFQFAVSLIAMWCVHQSVYIHGPILTLVSLFFFFETYYCSQLCSLIAFPFSCIFLSFHMSRSANDGPAVP